MPDLIGIIQPEQLNHYPWFTEGYNEAHFSIPRLRAIDTTGIEVLIFMGTWCGDTHEQLPAFMKLVDWTGAGARAKIIALGRDKKGPLTDTHQITRLPTFILLEHSHELGRITESPREDLLTDFERILSLRKH
jgi:thioredoxin 1